MTSPPYPLLLARLAAGEGEFVFRELINRYSRGNGNPEHPPCHSERSEESGGGRVVWILGSSPRMTVSGDFSSRE